MPKLSIPIVFQPKQAELYSLMEESAATWLGYGGSRGGAKSHAARAVSLVRRLKYPGTRGCILRRTYDLVRENHIEPLLAQYPVLRQWYKVGDKEIKFPNGSTQAFRYAETAGDVDGMIGKEYFDMVVDQAEAFTERELNVIKSVVRWTGSQSGKPKMVLTFNPGGVGHAFLKRIFFDRKYRTGELPEDYAFLQAYGWDNVEWARSALAADGLGDGDYYGWDSDKRFDYFIKRTQYGRELNALPPALRIGWLLGRMDQFAGQYFDVFDPAKHVQACRPDPYHSRWIGIDWGFGHEAAAYWGSQVRTNLFAVYREFVAAGRSPKALAQEICDRTPEEERPLVRNVALSHDAFSKRDERDPIASQMGDIFRRNQLPAPTPAGKDPVGAATLIYDMLRQGQLVIDPACPRLVEVIPMITRDAPDDPENTVKFEGDDPYDGLKHLLHHRIPMRARPKELEIREKAETIHDPLAKWFYLTKNLPAAKPPAVIEPNVTPQWMIQ